MGPYLYTSTRLLLTVVTCTLKLHLYCILIITVQYKIPFQKFQDTKWPASHTKDAIAPVLFFVCVVIRAIVVEKFLRLMDCLPFNSSTSEKQKTEVLVK